MSVQIAPRDSFRPDDKYMHPFVKICLFLVAVTTPVAIFLGDPVKVFVISASVVGAVFSLARKDSRKSSKWPILVFAVASFAVSILAMIPEHVEDMIHEYSVDSSTTDETQNSLDAGAVQQN